MSLTKSLTQPLPKRLTRSLPGDDGSDVPIPEVPPHITLQPIAVAIPVGDTFTLEMDAGGIEPITFKWQRRTMGTWVDIPGATGKTYTVASATLADTGQYRGVASNLYGDNPTDAALVEVLQAPVFTLQPVAFSDLYGEPISFTVDTEGYPAVAYQWYFKPEGGSFAALPGETAATLDLGLFDFGKVGEYYVAATNSQGTTNSNTVAAVFAGITITQQPVPMVIDHEDTISLSVAVDSIHPVTYQWFKVHTWYPDVTSYLTRVEAEDGQSLEPAVALAWDAFFRAMADPDHPTPTAATHKLALAAGTMIPMLGARTLAASLLPLYPDMPMPTNVGFVTGDYDRKTGLKGDGVGKYLNLGGFMSSVPQDDVSLWAIPQRDGDGVYISHGRTVGATNTTALRHFRSRHGAFYVGSSTIVPGALTGTSRHLSSEFQWIEGGLVGTRIQDSDIPFQGDTHVFNFSEGVPAWGSDTICCAGGGTSVDLEYLRDITTTLQSSIAAALA